MAAHRVSRHLLLPLAARPLRRAPIAAALVRRWNSSAPAAGASAPAASKADAPSATPVEEGKSDWYYVGWGSVFLFFFGCPMYLVYLLKEDDEMRIWMGENAPAVVEAEQGLIDVDEARRDSSYCNVARSKDGACLPRPHGCPFRSQPPSRNAEETLTITLPDGRVKSATLPAAATASEAAAVLGVDVFTLETASRVAGKSAHGVCLELLHLTETVSCRTNTPL